MAVSYNVGRLFGAATVGAPLFKNTEHNATFNITFDLFDDSVERQTLSLSNVTLCSVF